MSSPSIVVVGAGSIGRRHARNLKSLGAEVSITDVDERAARAHDTGARTIPFDSWHLSRPDGVVLATPTVHHAENLAEALAVCSHVLVEKPLVAHPDQLGVIAGREHDVMVGYNLRFHEPICALRTVVGSGRLGKVLAGRLWFGFHLPEWRPDTDYRTTYSAQRRLGGGVLLDAIHEVDLALWFFGELSVHSSFLRRLGPLEIDVEDTVRAILLTRDGSPVDLSLDYLSRRYRRGIEIIGEEGTARFDWDRGVLEIDTGDERQSTPQTAPIDDAYALEAAAFIDWIDGKGTPPVSGDGGAVSVCLAQAIRDRGT